MSEPRDWTKTNARSTSSEKAFASIAASEGIDEAIKWLFIMERLSDEQAVDRKMKLRKAKEIIRWMAAEMGKKE